MKRPFVLTIAGHDPSGGAGLTADCKTFEQLEVMGLSVCTAVTVQTGMRFLSVNWVEPGLVLEQTKMLVEEYKPAVVKIGLIQSVELLQEILKEVHQTTSAKVVWDPILKSGTGFVFHPKKIELANLLSQLTLITPNRMEAQELFGSDDTASIQKECLCHPNLSVLLKGGHSETDKGTDLRINSKAIAKIEGKPFSGNEKHGTGCILSAAISAWLAKGDSLEVACTKGKQYVERVMQSNHSLLGYHQITNDEFNPPLTPPGRGIG
jgi:hydroxymethylpyrimidine/phosphomethylpyrimidine kinase